MNILHSSSLCYIVLKSQLFNRETLDLSSLLKKEIIFTTVCFSLEFLIIVNPDLHTFDMFACVILDSSFRVFLHGFESLKTLSYLYIIQEKINAYIKSTEQNQNILKREFFCILITSNNNISYENIYMKFNFSHVNDTSLCMAVVFVNLN